MKNPHVKDDKEIAYQVARFLDEHDYPYLGVSLHLGGIYPYVELWDDRNQISRIIVCTSVRHDDKAQLFLDRYMAEHNNEKDSPSGLVGHLAQPHSTDESAFVLTEWIVEE